MISQGEYVSEYDRVETFVHGILDELKADPDTPFEEFMPHVIHMRFKRQVWQVCSKALRIIERQRRRPVQPIEGTE